jgi:hypothetical protein
MLSRICHPWSAGSLAAANDNRLFHLDRMSFRIEPRGRGVKTAFDPTNAKRRASWNRWQWFVIITSRKPDKMLRYFLPMVTVFGMVLSLAGHAQTPAVTATCNNGSAFSGATRSGACRGHGGVKTWDTAAPPATGAAPAPAMQSKTASGQTTNREAPGAGQVWVNTTSKLYHCAGDRWYGKTKAGTYMSEAQAKSSGFHPDHNKACAS